jgi:hypothetical protein
LPLIDEEWKSKHKSKWSELYKNHSKECPICRNSGIVWNGPLNSFTPTRCTHWFCSDCWYMLFLQRAGKVSYVPRGRLGLAKGALYGPKNEEKDESSSDAEAKQNNKLRNKQ